MDHTPSPKISSFVLRFVQEEAPDRAELSVVRGSIRHIQSDQELSFTQWNDALNFMRQFVPAETFE